jgi:ribonuclease HI
MKDRHKQLANLKQQRSFLDAKIAKLERSLFLPSGIAAAPRPPVEKSERAVRQWINSPDFTVEFDGGTSCNIPSKGFGKGYGSFQINGAEIHRVEFGIGHSCNSAEIRTLAAALEAIRLSCADTKKKSVLIRGDSKIALKWAKDKKQPSPSTTANFREAIELLRVQVAAFGCIRTEWRGRAHSVALFGH